MTRANFGIDSSADMYAWGLNGKGQLGVGDVTPRSSPVLVVGSKKWVALSNSLGEETSGSGDGSCLAIDNTGSAYAWGANSHGQLGVGNTTARSSPVLVVGGKRWAKVCMSGSSAYGITTEGDLYSWGRNATGELGTGNVTPQSSPVLVLGGRKYRDISAGSDGTNGIAMAIDTTGAAYSWGYNVNGGLGLGDVLSRSSPVLIAGGRQYNAVACSGRYAYLQASDGKIYSTGFNTQGQLGLNDTVDRSTPTLVVGSVQWTTTRQALVNSQIITVIPGTAYNVELLGTGAAFGGIGQYNPQSGYGTLPLKFILEYQA